MFYVFCVLTRFKDGDSRLTCANVNYDSCMYSALERHMVRDFGCVVPFIRSNERICKDNDSSIGAFNVAWDRVTNQVTTE